MGRATIHTMASHTLDRRLTLAGTALVAFVIGVFVGWLW